MVCFQIILFIFQIANSPQNCYTFVKYMYVINIITFTILRFILAYGSTVVLLLRKCSIRIFRKPISWHLRTKIILFRNIFIVPLHIISKDKNRLNIMTKTYLLMHTVIRLLLKLIKHTLVIS